VTAIAGSSGGGKSTAISLLRPGARPDSGQVRVGGLAVPSISRATWQRAVAVVGQDARLVADTVRANLLLGVPAADDRRDDELWEVLEATGARHLVDRLAGGLGAELDATALSGGERQRLVLARALLARPRLLVLDEALSHLDEDAEAELWPHLIGDGDRTTVVVAHRPSTLARADAVVAIDAGRAQCTPLNPEEDQENNT
jgi:ABC-type multidrug transport system fused ATPase/permease subunit